MAARITDEKIQMIRQLQTDNPEWGYKRIAKAAGVSRETARNKLRRIRTNTRTTRTHAPHITPEIVKAALEWREQHPEATWRETGEHFGVYGEQLRLASRQRCKTARLPSRLDKAVRLYDTPNPNHPTTRRRHGRLRPQYDANAVVSFYLGEGGHDKRFTAKKFGIPPWYVYTALIDAGYPDESCPSIVATHNSHPTPPQDTKIVPQEGNTNGTLKGLLLDHVAYVTSLETKVATLEQKLNEKGASNQRITEIAAKLEYELAHRD